MTREEARNAIQTFNHLLEGGELDANITCGDVVRATRIAVEALRSKSEAEEYRTPKKIIKVLAIDGTPCCGCPTCHGSVKYSLPYCPYCGQAIDWSEVE